MDELNFLDNKVGYEYIYWGTPLVPRHSITNNWHPNAMSTNTSEINTTSQQDKDAFQDAFSSLVENYFQQETNAREKQIPYMETGPVFTPEEEEQLLREWSECIRKHRELTEMLHRQIYNSRA